jgi:hypothetical protein
MQINLTTVKSFITRFLPYVIIVFLITQLYIKCESEKLQIANVSTLHSEAKAYKLKNGQLVLSKEVLQYTNKQLKESILSKDIIAKEMAKKFSVVKSVIKLPIETRIDTIQLPYKDSIPCLFDRVGRLQNKDYTIAYTSTQKGITIDFLSIPDTATIITGIKRKWFLGKQIATIDITHSNKYINNGEAEYYEVVQNKSFFNTTLFKIGAGILLGAIIIK